MVKRRSNLKVMQNLIREWKAGDLSNKDFISLIIEGATLSDLLEEKIAKSLLHINYPFDGCGFNQNQWTAVYWHVRGKSARAIGEIMGKSRYTVWGYLRQAVKKINEAEDWNIKIVDLPDMLLRLIKEALDGEEKSR